MVDREHPSPPVDPGSISAAELKRRLDAGERVRILDLRNRDETEAWQIDGPSVTVTQVPLSRFLQAQVTDGVSDLASDIAGQGPITAVCAEGEASRYAAGLLVDAGIDAHNLADGMAGWARLYEAHRIETDPTVVQYHRPSSGCLAYLVRSGGEAAVIDPLRAFTARYVEDVGAATATLVAVVDTHVHADHVSGLRPVAAASRARRIVPAGAVDRGITFDVETVADGETIPIGDTALRAVELPGHTTDMTGIAVGDVLLTGDSLFLDGVARPDLQVAAGADPESLARRLYRTLTDRLAAIPDGTLIAPGHTHGVAPGGAPYTATLGTLRDSLPVFEMDESAFVRHVTADLPPPPANAERIIDINLGAEGVDDETAFELELGPNNCAVTVSG